MSTSLSSNGECPRARSRRRPPSPTGDNGGRRAPSPTADNGRDNCGRFSKGNRAARGNPFARQIGAFRSALCQALTEADIRALAATLLVMAKSGNLVALKLLFQYAIGKPTDAVDPDRLDQDEWRLLEQTAVQGEAVVAALNRMPAELASGILERTHSGVTDQMACDHVNRRREERALWRH